MCYKKTDFSRSAILITRHEPTKPIVQEAKEAGTFKLEMFQPFDKLQKVTVQQFLDGVRMNLSMIVEVADKSRATDNGLARRFAAVR